MTVRYAAVNVDTHFSSRGMSGPRSTERILFFDSDRIRIIGHSGHLRILYIKSGRPYKPFTTVRLALCSSLTDAALLHYLFKSTDGITYLAMLVLDSWKLTPEAGVPNGFSGSIGVPTNTCILRRFTWGRGSSRLILGLVLFNCCNRKSQVIHKSR